MFGFLAARMASAKRAPRLWSSVARLPLLSLFENSKAARPSESDIFEFT